MMTAPSSHRRKPQSASSAISSSDPEHDEEDPPPHCYSSKPPPPTPPSAPNRRSTPSSPDRQSSHSHSHSHHQHHHHHQRVKPKLPSSKNHNNGVPSRRNPSEPEMLSPPSSESRVSVDRSAATDKSRRHETGTGTGTAPVDSPNPNSIAAAIDQDVFSNPQSLDLGPLLLKLARALHLSGENPLKALECAARAAKFLERSSAATGKPSLDHVTSLHLLAAIYCRLGRLEEALPALQQSVAVARPDQGTDHALAAFAGHMQLGDILALVGRHDSALTSYHTALDIQKSALGEMDPQVHETCIYIAEAHLQALQFIEAEEMCQHALKIHSELSQPGSVEEAKDRRLLALVLGGKGEFESALEHLVLASVAFTSSGSDMDVAEVDSSIGDMYVALGRYDEAIFSYQKALNLFKTVHGEAHASVACVYVNLAELYMKTGKQREAKGHCENALRIYGRQSAAHSRDDLASGLSAIASVFESMNEPEQALCLLQRALNILEELPGRQVAAAGAESQMGVLYIALGRYEEAFMALKNAVSKLTVGTGKRSALLGIVLNQMGLACVGLNEIWHAATTFEESRSILEECCGPHHMDTLSVCSNLAGTYDALGRSDDAIQLLEGILEVKEERLGTAHPDTEEERERLTVMLKEVGRTRVRKTNTLEELLLLTSVEGRSRPQPAITTAGLPSD